MTHLSTKRSAQALIAAAAIAVPAVSAQAGLTAYYSFDDAANLGQDSSGNGIDLELRGGPSAVSGQVSGAASFDGSDDIMIHKPADDIYQAGPVSASFWVKPDTATGNGQISRPASSGGGGLTFGPGGSPATYRVTFNSSSFDNINSGVQLVADEYAHFAVTFEPTGSANSAGEIPGTAKVYVNGDLKSTQTVNYLEGGFRFGLGARASNGGDGADFFSGDLDEFAVFDETLTGDQVAGLADGSFTPLTVPEPASLAMLSLGCVGVLFRRRHR